MIAEINYKTLYKIYENKKKCVVVIRQNDTGMFNGSIMNCDTGETYFISDRNFLDIDEAHHMLFDFYTEILDKMIVSCN